MRRTQGGGEALARALRDAGVRMVFGMPGSQNVSLIEGLRRSRVRFVGGTSELAAGFMANGYARVSRRAAVLVTIPGPGFAFALPPIAEARLDGIPLVWICVAPEESPDGRAVLQGLPQEQVARPLVKAVLSWRPSTDPGPVLDAAARAAEEGEPGPVLLEVPAAALARSAPGRLAANGSRYLLAGEPPLRCPPPPRERLDEAVRRTLRARRPVLWAGRGALDAAREVRAAASALDCLVFTTTSGRGVLPEDDPDVLVADGPAGRVDHLRDVVEGSDLIVALGCGFTHNGTHGFSLPLDPGRLLDVNSRPEPTAPPYAGSHHLRSDVRSFLKHLLAGLPARRPDTGSGEAGGRWRPPQEGGGSQTRDPGRGRMRDLPGPDSPALPRPKAAAERPGLGEFLRMLAEEGGRDAIVVTDSGRHQMIVRRDHRVFSAGGLLVPTDLQSMGFGIPAAIGAKLAAPHRPVVAIVGDGGFRLTALELLVAQREGVPILTVVVNDGELGLIADEQRKAYGRACDTRVSIPELSLLARSLGLPVLGMAGGRRDALEGVLRGEGAGVLEVGVEEEERVPPRSTAAMLWRRAAQAGLRRITPRRLRRLAVALRTGGGRPGSES